MSGRQPAMFRNHYACPRCAGTWSDVWSCQVDDDCPACGLRHISPEDSEDAEEDGWEGDE